MELLCPTVNLFDNEDDDPFPELQGKSIVSDDFHTFQQNFHSVFAPIPQQSLAPNKTLISETGLYGSESEEDLEELAQNLTDEELLNFQETEKKSENEVLFKDKKVVESTSAFEKPVEQFGAFMNLLGSIQDPPEAQLATPTALPERKRPEALEKEINKYQAACWLMQGRTYDESFKHKKLKLPTMPNNPEVYEAAHRFKIRPAFNKDAYQPAGLDTDFYQIHANNYIFILFTPDDMESPSIHLIHLCSGKEVIEGIEMVTKIKKKTKPLMSCPGHTAKQFTISTSSHRFLDTTDKSAFLLRLISGNKVINSKPFLAHSRKDKKDDYWIQNYTPTKVHKEKRPRQEKTQKGKAPKRQKTAALAKSQEQFVAKPPSNFQGTHLMDLQAIGAVIGGLKYQQAA